MFNHAKSRVITQALIAAVVGTAVGSAAGLWSLRHDGAKMPPAVQTTPEAARPEPQSAPPRVQSEPVAANAAKARPTPAAADPAVGGGTRQPRLTADGGGDVLQRARTLAERPDVNALIALRENVAGRAKQLGESGLEAIQQQLEEIDRYLAQARALRLKLDAEEFRKSTAAANRPRLPNH